MVAEGDTGPTGGGGQDDADAGADGPEDGCEYDRATSVCPCMYRDFPHPADGELEFCI